MDLSRREFVKSSAVASLLAVPVVALDQAASAKSEVFVGKGNAEIVIPKILAKMGGIGRFVKPGSRVVIKPNMSFANPPEWGTTTSPEVVAILAKLCLDAGAKRVIVCDNTLRDPQICKAQTGIGAALKDLKGVVIFTPQQVDSFYEEKSHPKALELTRTEVVKEVLAADALICLPAAKSHSAGGVSFGIKGLMGLVKNRGRFHSEMDLHKAIAEQLYYMTPTLTLIDATRALLDNGPAGPGKVVTLNTYVAGTDPVATDSFGVSLAPWYGRSFDGKQVTHLQHASALGFGNVDSAKISEITV